MLLSKKKNIFNELKINENELFTNLNKSDLEYLLSLINLYKLSLRDKINVDTCETFGLEIECENANWKKLEKRITGNWELTDDLSLEDGAEIKSPPLRDTMESWITLKKMCSIISKYAQIGMNSSGHVHIGIQALGEDNSSLINFLKLWGVYEHIIYRFSYGEFLGPRPGIKDAAKSVRIDFFNSCYLYENEYSNKESILTYLCDDKCKAVNFRHYDTLKTLEFRCPNATLNPVIWQNNVNLFVKMMLYSKRKDFNKLLIDDRKHKLLIEDKTANKIYLNDALEFIDLIFDNNLDKVYFLRQYLKSFEVSQEYEMAKSFSNT